MHIGRSNQRLEQNEMVEMDEIREFSAQLCRKMPSFAIMYESEISRIVVLQNQVRHTDRWIREYFETSSPPTVT